MASEENFARTSRFLVFVGWKKTVCLEVHAYHTKFQEEEAVLSMPCGSFSSVFVVSL
jgi:hypothetical protein